MISGSRIEVHMPRGDAKLVLKFVRVAGERKTTSIDSWMFDELAGRGEQ